MSQAVLSERQRFLLLVLYLTSKHVKEKGVGYGEHAVPSRIRITNLIFLLQKEGSEHVERLAGGIPYTFEPRLHGPFSEKLLSDLRELQRLGLIKVYTEPIDVYGMAVRYVYVLTEEGVREAEEMVKHLESNTGLRDTLKHVEFLVRKYASMSTDELLSYVYRKYPEESTPAF